MINKKLVLNGLNATAAAYGRHLSRNDHSAVTIAAQHDILSAMVMDNTNKHLSPRTERILNVVQRIPVSRHRANFTTEDAGLFLGAVNQFLACSSAISNH